MSERLQPYKEMGGWQAILAEIAEKNIPAKFIWLLVAEGINLGKGKRFGEAVKKSWKR